MMRFLKSSCMGWCAAAVAGVLLGSTAVHASTTSVVTFSEGGPTALPYSGLTAKSFWSIGAGGGSFSNSGNNAYSSQTGGAVTPEEANVLHEQLAMFVVDEGGNKSAVPTFVKGGELVQVNNNQTFVSELFGGANQSGSAPFNYSLPENAPYYVRSVNPVPDLPGGTLYLNGARPTTVPVPEPAAVSLLALAGLGILLLPRRRHT
ncbi:MAG: hypothetical protein ACP5I8_12415 [Phycisphaerae bacterium]